jgi:hypothetical protein
LARENASLFNLVYKISGDLKHVKPKEKSMAMVKSLWRILRGGRIKFSLMNKAVLW